MVVSALQPGSVIDGRYSVAVEIGAGSFGVVYLAHDMLGRKNVAVKTLRPSALRVPELVERMVREVEVCKQLKHLSTVRLLDAGNLEVKDPGESGAPEEVPYLVFELVRGLPLGELLEHRPPLSIRETCRVCIAVLDALQEAHLQGIVHRDLKPNNILIEAPKKTWQRPAVSASLSERLGIPEPDEAVWHDLTKLKVKVHDFGLAKLLAIGDRRVKKLTAKGVLAGTAHYMSPEQVERGHEVDYRADIYGVAMLISRLLTGRTPYGGDTSMVVAMRHVTDPLPPLPDPWADHAIAQIYKRAGAKDPEERYPSAAEMAWAMRCIVAPDLAQRQAPEFEVPPLVTAGRGFWSRLFGR